MKDRKLFVRFFNLFFISIFVLFLANSALLLYLSNKDLVNAGREYYSQKAENISQRLDDSLLMPLSGIVFDQFGSFQSSSMMNFLIYEKHDEFANDLSREITTEILRHEWLKSIIVYREDGRIITDRSMRKNIDDSFQGTQLQGIINCIIKKNSVSGWISPAMLNYDMEKVLMYYIKYPITNPLRNRGIILYVIDSSFLADEIRKSIDPAVARLMIEDDIGQILFSYGNHRIPAWINATRPEKLETTTLWKGNDRTWQVIWKPLPSQKISLALVVSSTLFQRNLLYSQRLNFALALLFFVGLAIYLLFIKSHVHNPLAKAMDALRSMVHDSGHSAKRSTLRSDTAKIVDENRNLIAYRFVINLITEGLEKKDFVHICEILGIPYCNFPFHVVLIEHNPLSLQNASWETRELEEEYLQRQWEANMPADRTLSIRYPAGGLVCLFFVDSACTLPIGALFRHAHKTQSNIVFSNALTETADFPKTYDILVKVLDKKLYYGYGNVFSPEDTHSLACKAFAMEPLKGFLLGDRYQEFKTVLISDLKRMEKDGFPPVIMRDYFVHISELISETYQKKARNKDNPELSHVIMREEVQKLVGIGEFVEWADEKIQILKGSVQCSGEETNRELVQQIKEFIALSLDRNITQDMVAEHFGISSGYLSRLFREYSAEGFSVYLKECKLQEAARQIKEKECDSVAGLAWELGYSSVAYFSRQFKKRFGLLPHEYAKRPEKILD